MISLIACDNASCLLFILSQVSRRIHEFAIFLWEVTSYCLGARKPSWFPGTIFLRKNHGAFSKWLTDLSYWWILLAAALILLGLYFVFNAFERTRKVKLQLLVLSAMDLVTLLFFLLTFNLRISKLAAESGATPRTMPSLWALFMLFISIVYPIVSPILKKRKERKNS